MKNSFSLLTLIFYSLIFFPFFNLSINLSIYLHHFHSSYLDLCQLFFLSFFLLLSFFLSFFLSGSHYSPVKNPLPFYFTLYSHVIDLSIYLTITPLFFLSSFLPSLLANNYSNSFFFSKFFLLIMSDSFVDCFCFSACFSLFFSVQPFDPHHFFIYSSLKLYFTRWTIGVN